MGTINYIDIIIFFIKSFIMNMYIYYCYNKIVGIKNNNAKDLTKFMGCNLLLTIPYTYLEFNANSVLYIAVLYILLGIIMSFLSKNKMGYSLVVTVIAYAICTIGMVISAIINFIPYNYVYKHNYYLNLISVLLIQFVFIYVFFKIKRFRNGFAFLNKRLNNDVTDVVVNFISIAVVLIAAFMGTLHQGYKTVTRDLLIIFTLLGITMYIMIRKTLTLYYKQTQILKTLNEYKSEIDEKDKEIAKLSQEKFNTSKIRHEFYNRQRALELLVKENMSSNSVNKENNINQNILDIIQQLSNEYSEECEKIKELSVLDKTDIPEIDSMFKYMQLECAKNNIDFKLKVVGSIYPLINNIISKSKLETLIGDHLKDAINAVNNDTVENKGIMAMIGTKNGKYELSIHDTGVEFEINTLLKLGKEAVTTCLDKGGSGIGFLTTFETMKDTKASLIITEYEPSDKRYYTKTVTIRFDSKNQYKIVSYRSKQITNKNTTKQILIENINK